MITRNNIKGGLTVTALTLAAIATGAILNSCDDDNGGDTGPTSGYVLGFRTASDPTADYLLPTADVTSGNISAVGSGTELEDWSFYGRAGDNIIVYNYGDFYGTAYAYEVNQGEITKTGQTIVEGDMVFAGDDETVCLVKATWLNEGTFQFRVSMVNGNAAVTKEVDLPLYEYYVDDVRKEAWPTGGSIIGDKFYLSYYFIDFETFEPAATDSAFVSVYSYPDFDYITTYKDNRTGPLGSYGAANALITDDSDNIYAISNTAHCIGYPERSKPAGLLRISRDDDAFDADYFFDTEALGYRVLQGVYAGNGKIVARMVTVDTDNSAEPWAAFGSDHDTYVCLIAVLDVNAKTVTPVTEIPVHKGQYQFPSLVEDGKVHLSIANETQGVYVYTVDPSNATAVRGALIQGQEIQAFYKY